MLHADGPKEGQIRPASYYNPSVSGMLQTDETSPLAVQEKCKAASPSYWRYMYLTSHDGGCDFTFWMGG